MKRKRNIILLIFLSLTSILIASKIKQHFDKDDFVTYIVNTQKQDLQFYWKDENSNIISSLQNLRSYVERKKQKLIFAMNGGMFKKDLSSQGLFISNGQILTQLDTTNGIGNFYLQPNGVFYISTNNIPVICKTVDFKNYEKIKYATQSGPMLVVDGKIHSAFKDGSTNLNIRNGVGILPNNNVVFAMSKKEINLYDFAKYFQSLGCKNALYLDGFVSRTYLPEKKWIQLDGNFGVMIGVTELP